MWEEMEEEWGKESERERLKKGKHELGIKLCCQKVFGTEWMWQNGVHYV